MTYTPSAYVAKDYSKIKGLTAITDIQIEEHLKLYAGYVKRTNALIQKLADMSNEKHQDDSSFQELKRRLGWEFNGMRLHEFYFDQLAPGGSGGLKPDSGFGALVAKQFGSVEAWTEDFMGTAKMPGIGWVVTYHDPTNCQVINTWIEQHHEGHLTGCKPLLILDIFEHAFTVYLKPTQRAQYLTDFMANVDWTVVGKRLELVPVCH
jgi:superoxide dismutase, Fe-Mn family